jgi:hypothetical protein
MRCLLIILLSWSFSVYPDTQEATTEKQPDPATLRENPVSSVLCCPGRSASGKARC